MKNKNSTRVRASRAQRGKKAGKRQGVGRSGTQAAETESPNAPQGSLSHDSCVRIGLIFGMAARESEVDRVFLERFANRMLAGKSGDAIVAMMEALAGLVGRNSEERTLVIQAAVTCQARFRLKAALSTLEGP